MLKFCAGVSTYEPTFEAVKTQPVSTPADFTGTPIYTFGLSLTVSTCVRIHTLACASSSLRALATYFALRLLGALAESQGFLGAD